MTDEPLRAFLRREALRCVQPPTERFRHPWLSPMPPSVEGARWLAAQRAGSQRDDTPAGGDRFALGDYGLGLFHHDVSESAIALAREPELAEACLGSLLCFLDCASADGCIHRTELPHRTRDAEPAKPVMAQLALRVLEGDGARLDERFDEHRVLPRLLAFIDYLERTHVGAHGLFLTPSARASGFDSDLLSAGFPERSIEGPDTNALMVLEYLAAGELARRLGDGAAASLLSEKAEALAERIEALLWYEDDRGGTYVALRSRQRGEGWEDEVVGHRDPDGVLRPIASWVGLLPLYAGIPSLERAAKLVERLASPAGFWGPVGVRTLSRESVFFHQAPRVLLYDPRRGEPGPVSNWMGPVWVLSSYYLARGLERYGEQARARELDERTVALLADDLRCTGTLHECYDDEGRGLWPLAGGFVSWSVLALTLPGPSGDPVLALGR